VSSTCFISDLHLDPARPAVTRALASFLGSHTHCRRLYILGDLFEAWLGDDDDAPLVTEVAHLLGKFSGAGPELYLMHGNRDFLLGQRFCRAVGAQLLPDPSVIDLYGTPTLLMHGDSLCTADVQYQQFRRSSRDPAWQDEILGRSLDERRDFAARLREISREAVSNKAEDIIDVSATEVEQVMTRHGVRQLIHGHTHRPARHQGPWGTRWVLGDWDQQGWVLEASAQSIDLKNIDIIQQVKE
jgi:UDP-2,3-diacylglucosamine hydrolase